MTTIQELERKLEMAEMIRDKAHLDFLGAYAADPSYSEGLRRRASDWFNAILATESARKELEDARKTEGRPTTEEKKLALPLTVNDFRGHHFSHFVETADGFCVAKGNEHDLSLLVRLANSTVEKDKEIEELREEHAVDQLLLSQRDRTIKQREAVNRDRWDDLVKKDKEIIRLTSRVEELEGRKPKFFIGDGRERRTYGGISYWVEVNGKWLFVNKDGECGCCPYGDYFNDGWSPFTGPVSQNEPEDTKPKFFIGDGRERRTYGGISYWVKVNDRWWFVDRKGKCNRKLIG